MKLEINKEGNKMKGKLINTLRLGSFGAGIGFATYSVPIAISAYYGGLEGILDVVSQPELLAIPAFMTTYLGLLGYMSGGDKDATS